MELSEITRRVRQKADDTELDTQVIADAANDFVYELFNNTRTRLMESTDTISFSAGDTAQDLPSDFMNLIGLWTTSPAVQEITDSYVDYTSFMRSYANYATAASRAVNTWTDFNNQILLPAAASADTTLSIAYMREPTPMENQNDTCEVPRRYLELVVLGTYARIQEQNEDYDEGAQERDNLASLVTAFIRNEARGNLKIGGKRIRTSMSGGRSTYRADRDF